VAAVNERKSLDNELEWLALGNPRKRAAPSWGMRLQIWLVSVIVGAFIVMGLLLWLVAACPQPFGRFGWC
jgi:hypothetical protein